MFTGIIEALGRVMHVAENGGNRTYTIESPLSHALKIDQSLSHNGVCLTVESQTDSQHTVTAITETLIKSNLGHWKPGTLVNLERSLAMQGRLDGHIVQGHVDTTGRCSERIDQDGSWVYQIEFSGKFAELVIEKGSICLNGISLTIFDVTPTNFRVAIIPYTFEHTNMQSLMPGDTVNLEFDMLGKYVQRIMQVRAGA
jgi:riboflavin synthase